MTCDVSPVAMFSGGLPLTVKCSWIIAVCNESEREVKVSLLLKPHDSTLEHLFNFIQYFSFLFDIPSVTGWTQATEEG